MAVLHTKHNANKNKRAGTVLAMAVSVLLPAAAAVLYAVLLLVWQIPVWTGVFVLAAAAAGAVMFCRMKQQSAILKSGIDGEQKVASLLKQLPDSYHILVNPVFHVHGRTMELDALVIGRNGVFIVETKNHSGAISGDIHAKWWRQEKRTETKQMKNPLLQAERQQHLTEQLLRDKKQSSPVHSYVYFANPNAKVTVQDSRIFTDAEALRREIRRQKSSSPVNTAVLVSVLNRSCD